MKVGVRTDNEAIMASLRETLRYGLFLGTFAGAFCTVDESIAAIGGCRRSDDCTSLKLLFRDVGTSATSKHPKLATWWWLSLFVCL